MKKVLLGTSAIALAGAFASQANAAEWEVRVGGYMEQYAAYADVDIDGDGVSDRDGDGEIEGVAPGADINGIDAKQDSEVYFLPSITLDNGLQFGVNIQLEGQSSSAHIDESYAFIDGSFGEINIGDENSAGYKMMYSAPDVTFVGTNSGSLSAWIPFNGEDYGDDFFRGTLGNTWLETLRNSDIARFTYYTPRFAGFQVGVSYARDNTEDSNAALDCNTNPCDFFDVGANYVNSFGDFNVALSGRYGWVDAPSGGNPEVWAAGLNLGYAGFTIGGSYAEADKDHGVMHGHGWDAGVSYETGPWGVSFTYQYGENINNDCGGIGGCAGLDEEELDQWLAGVTYTLAQGVRLGAFGGYADFDEETDEDNMDGWVVGTGMALSW